MNPSIHLPQYSVIVCKKCKYAVLPSQIDAHLSNRAKHGYDKEQRQTVIQEVAKIPGLIQSEVQLEAFQFPPKTAIGIPELKAPKPNGLKCRSCEYVICHQQLIQEHCRTVHGWENERKKGRPLYNEQQVEPELPWIPGVHCQQFFKQGPKSGFFEVATIENISEDVQVVDVWTKVEKITQERLEHIEKKAKEKVEEADENAEPNPWLKRVGWVRHLKGKNPKQLRVAIKPPNLNKEPYPVLWAGTLVGCPFPRLQGGIVLSPRNCLRAWNARKCAELKCSQSTSEG
jgi:Orsellinic acid/F9775 biosynthesis cluster protein D